MRSGVALGANLGDRLEALRTARDALSSWSATPEAVLSAPVYETDPVDCPDGSGAFYNSVVEIDFAGSPESLLERCTALEKAMGRPAARESDAPNAPRPIDLDILYCNRRVLATERLTLPHPRLHLRRFVLEPLSRIRPHLVLPGMTATVRELLEALQSSEPPLRLVAENW